MENRGPLHFGFWNVDFGLNLIEFLIGIRKRTRYWIADAGFWIKYRQ